MKFAAFKKLRDELRQAAEGLESEKRADLNNLLDAHGDELAQIIPIEAGRTPPHGVDIFNRQVFEAWDVKGHESVIAFQAGPVMSEDDPPEDFKILNFGTTRMRKGGRIFNVIYDEEARESIFKALEAQGRKQLPIDFDHGMLGFISSRDSSMSAGWFTLEARSDGLYATDIEWTKKAFESIKEREFRFTSPALFLEELEQVGDFRATEVINVALTNLPATVSQKPLVASSTPDEEHEMKFTKEMLEKLGLKEDASDEQITERLIALSGAETAAETAKTEAAKATELAASAATIAETKTADLAAAKAEQQSLLDSQNASGLDQIAERLSKIEQASATMATHVATLEAEKKQTAQQRVFDGLDAEGKLPESLHEWAKTQTAEQLAAWGKGAPVVMSAARHTAPAPGAAPIVAGAAPIIAGAGAAPGGAPLTVSLTAEDQQIAQLMALPVEKFAAVRATEGQPLQYQNNAIMLSRIERNKPAQHYIQPFMTGRG